MRVETTRFGELDVEEGRVIVFPSGLPGFPLARRFALLGHAPGSPFHWLQSLDEPDLAFAVTDPRLADPEYLEAIPKEALGELGLAGLHEAVVLAMVTIERTSGRATANLLGPLLIHAGTGQARQLVLNPRRFSTRHEILPGPVRGQLAAAAPSGALP
jgi:flagellar assembly factor FliW